MRVLLALAPLLLVVACAPESLPRIHEVVLYGAENTRLTYFYGMPTSLVLGEREVALARGGETGDDPLAIPVALEVDGEPYLRERVQPLTDAPGEVRTIGRSSDLRVALRSDTGPVIYYDGSMWFTLLGDGRAGVDTRVVPRPRLNALRGLGELSRAEADALAAYLEGRGEPVAVFVLDEVPAQPRPANGADEYLRTGLYLQTQFAAATASSAPRADELVWEVLAEGSSATGFEGPGYFLVEDVDSLRTLWNRAHGSQLQVPDLPEVEFARETVVAIFLGNRPTGGYGVDVERAVVERGELYLDVRIREPSEGDFTTQAITSPWVMVRVLRGGFDYAWVRNAATDRLLGAARPLE